MKERQIFVKSKSKFFSLLVELDCNKKQYVNLLLNKEFKGLYEINEEKNSLNKIYSTNFYPSTIDFIEIQDLLTFDTELKVFKKKRQARLWTNCPPFLIVQLFKL